MTKDEFQKAVDDVITDCIRNNYSFGSYAYKVTEAVWPLLEAAEKAVNEAYQRGYETGQEEVEKERDELRAKVTSFETGTLKMTTRG